MAKRVAIVGGGVTGLMAALELERTTDFTIDLYERSDRLGGKVQSVQMVDCLVEFGPDALFTRKPGTLEILRDLGLTDLTVNPDQKEFSLLIGGRLHRVPGGLVTLTTSDPDALDEAQFLSEEVKQRVRAEADQPAGTAEDESIRSFFTRRFGSEFTRWLVEPLLAGTHGGDADHLSMRALYPGYFRLERQHGSLAAAMASSGNRGTSGASFVSFPQGMEELVNHLVGLLRRTHRHISHPIHTTSIFDADAVLVTVPAPAAADMLQEEAPCTSELLRTIPHRSRVIVTLAYARTQFAHPLQGTGFLVPDSTEGDLSGSTWSSEKWPNRAPRETVLIRAFLRSDGVGRSDEELIRTATLALRQVLQISGPPTFCHVQRWPHALPQYEVGHLDRVSQIDASLAREAPRITLAGTSYRGAGVPDCLRQGRDAARSLAETL